MAANGVHQYTRKVINKGGSVVTYPEVISAAALKDAEVTINPYAESSTQLFPLGTELNRGERKWRYCKAGGTGLNIGAVQQQAVAIHAEADQDIAVGAAFAIGVYDISLTSTTNLATAPLNAADGFAEGYVYFNIAAGLGQCYKIKSHAAFSSTDEIAIELYDPLTIALTTSSKAGLVQNPYANVIVAATPVTGVVAGVPGLAVAANYYFWIQTRGPAAVAINTTLALGTAVVVGTTAGKGDPFAAFTTEIPIGFAMTPGVTGGADHTCVFLTIE